jgi:hypothetical protein
MSSRDTLHPPAPEPSLKSLQRAWVCIRTNHAHVGCQARQARPSLRNRPYTEPRTWMSSRSLCLMSPKKNRWSKKTDGVPGCVNR